MTHEMVMHDASCMLNLTYDDDHLPVYGQLLKDDLQKFFKRLRKQGYKFKYVASGEYGDESRRPHFHIALFGVDFAASRVQWGRSRSGDRTYISESVSRIWPQGQHLIGTLNFESCAYIARYILKKQKGPDAVIKPLAVTEDGEVILPNPEFMTMSKGIGRSWFRDYFMSDVFPHAAVITSQGSKAPVPRFYKTLLKEVGEDLALDMSFRSSVRAEAELEARTFENKPHRRSARAIVNNAKSKLSARNI